MSARASRTIVVAGVATLLISTVAFAASVLASPAANSRDGGRPIVVTFTKWITINPGPPMMQGVVGGGDVPPGSKFAGQVMFDQNTDLAAKLGAPAVDVEVIQAVYEAEAGDHSFTALIQGGENNQSHTAVLDGVVLRGWHTGAKVRVQFHDVPNCPRTLTQGNALGDTCFTGTITITPDSEN
jgi:hypothetical protein